MAVASTSSIPAEPHMLEAARRGDEAAFNAIVEPYLSEVHAHCYRMLASLDDADEAVQETLLRAWRGLGGFGGRRLIRPWLYRIATNVCLDVIARRPKRVLPSDRAPAASLDHPEERPAGPIWLEPYPDERLGIEDGVATPEARYEQREAVELAFIAALQHLPRDNAPCSCYETCSGSHPARRLTCWIQRSPR